MKLLKKGLHFFIKYGILILCNCKLFSDAFRIYPFCNQSQAYRILGNIRLPVLSYQKSWIMKCGYCKNEMIKGVIPTPAIEWHPDNRTSKLSYDNDKKQGFRIGRHSFFDMKEQEA